MFKKINDITDKVSAFAYAGTQIVYHSYKIGEKIWKLVKIDEKNIFVDEPETFIYNPQIFGDDIVVATKNGGGYLYNQDLSRRRKIDFMIQKISYPCSLFLASDSKEGSGRMGFINNETHKIQWQLDYVGGQNYIGEDTFYAVKPVDKKNNHLYAYDKKTGEEKWLYVIEQEELYGIVYFYTEYQGKLFINAKKHLVLDCETGKLISSSKAYGGTLYYENKVPHLLSFYSRLNLETFEETLFDIKPLLVPYWGDYQKTTYMDCLVEGNILIGTHESLVTTNSPEEAAFHLLLINPDKNEVVWSHEFPYKGLSNYKEARYENGKLYFLDKDGCLTIFEREI